MMNKSYLLFVSAAFLSAGAAFADADKTVNPAAAASSNAAGTTIPAPPFAATAVSDNFNRADGPIGGSWTVQAGSFNIVSNAAQGGSLALATYNGGTGDTLEADVQATGTALQYVGLVLNYFDLSNNLFFKVQQQDGGGKFDHGACYYGNNGSSWGLGFFTLSATFTTAHMKVAMSGTTATITFSNIDGGSGTQTYSCAGAPATGGAGIGISGYDINYGRLDNFSNGVVAVTYTVADTTDVPDLNGNGSSEEATLVKSSTGGTYVYIRDTKTKALLKALSYGTGYSTLVAVSVVSDMNANGKPEIGVTALDSTGAPKFVVRDSSTGALLSIINLP